MHNPVSAEAPALPKSDSPAPPIKPPARLPIKAAGRRSDGEIDPVEYQRLLNEADRLTWEQCYDIMKEEADMARVLLRHIGLELLFDLPKFMLIALVWSSTKPALG